MTVGTKHVVMSNGLVAPVNGSVMAIGTLGVELTAHLRKVIGEGEAKVSAVHDCK